MSYQGNIRLGKTIDVKFTTIDSTGAPVTLAGSPAVAAYPDNSTTEITAGITLTVDFDSRTGLHNVRVVATSGNGYATATNYALILTAGTVSGVSVVGYKVASFSIENRSALMPTTADRTLDVSATGEGDANVVQVDGAALDTHDAGSFPADVRAILGDTTGATNLDTVFRNDFSVAYSGVLAGWNVNVQEFGGVAGTFSGGRPEVNTTHAAGTAWGSGAITRATFAADTGLQSQRSGTLQSGGLGSVVLDASASAVNQFYRYSLLLITGGTGAGQCRLIYDYVGATKSASVLPAFATAPDGTSTFAVIPYGVANVELWLGIAPQSPYHPGIPMVDIQAVGGTETQVRGLDRLNQGTLQGSSINTVTLEASASSVDNIYVGCQVCCSASEQLRLIIAYNGTTKVATVAPDFVVVPNAGVEFYVICHPFAGVVNVQSFGGAAGTFSGGRPEVNASHAAGTAWNSGAIGPNTIAADTITAAKVAADAGTEIGTAVWASATRTLTANPGLDAAGIRTAVGLASANLDTQLDAIPTNSELATAIITGLTTALTEGYRGTGATGSVRDLLYEIMAGVLDNSISGTLKTSRKIDGTTAKTYTLDSATTPTSITETT